VALRQISVLLDLQRRIEPQAIPEAQIKSQKSFSRI
jgi:hypothetical protein